MKKTIYILAPLLLIAGIAGYWYCSLPEEVTIRLSPIDLTNLESIGEKKTVQFRGKEYVCSVEFIESDEDIGGDSSICVTVENWSVGKSVKVHFLNQNNQIFPIKGRVIMDGIEKEADLPYQEYYRGTSPGHYLKTKWVLKEDLPKTMIPVIELTHD